MRASMKEVLDLLKAKIQCIWIRTHEEAEVIKDLREIANELLGYDLYVWSHTEGLKKIPLTDLEKESEPNAKLSNPRLLFQKIKEGQDSGGQAIYVLRDFHLLNGAHEMKRALRDLKEYSSRSYNPIIVISPVVDIPVEHEKLFTVVEYDVPSREEIREMVDMVASGIEKAIQRGRELELPSEEEKEALVNAAIGLTHKEINDVFAKSLIKHKKLSVESVMEEKIQMVKKSGVLDYKIPEFTFDDIGGNKAFKEWVEEIQESFSDEARDFGVPRPKGYLSIGIPGTSKTAGAEAIASKFKVPFLKLDMSRIMNRLVGESERNIDQAFRVAKSVAPCVLLIDEVEKVLGGISSSNASDSGTLARVFAKILEFLNEDNDVFVIMTSNDISQLPPELTRAGRLDAIWYFSLPNRDERKEIFKIHINKAGREATEELLETGADVTENFSGAEIAEVVKVAMRKAFKRYKQDKVNSLLAEDIKEAAEEIIPLYRSSKEKIIALESWAEGKARNANESKSALQELNDSMLLDDVILVKR